MASSYALPVMNGGSHHGHSHSYSSIHLSPSRADSSAFPSSNGSFVKKAMSNGNLYTHAETSRETSPMPSPNQEHNHYDAFERNLSAFNDNFATSKHQHSHSHSPLPMKSRTRGESDLGRPANPHSHVYKPTLGSIPAAPTSWFSLPEALTALLIPLPYMLASAAYSSNSGPTIAEDGFPPLSAYAKLQKAVLTSTSELPPREQIRPSGLIEALTLSTGTLLLVGVLAKIRSSERLLDRRKDAGSLSSQVKALVGVSALRSVASRAASLVLPFYAAMQVGGMRTGLILLVAMAANLTCSDSLMRPSLRDWKHALSSRLGTLTAIALSVAADFAGLTIHATTSDLTLGYLALALSMLVIQPPLPSLGVASSSRPTLRATTPTSTSVSWSKLPAASPLIASVRDADLTLLAGVVMFIVTLTASHLLAASPSLDPEAVVFSILCLGTMAASIHIAQPSLLRNQHKAGLGVGCMLTASCAFLFSPSLWPGTILNGGLAALAWFGVLYDTASPTSGKHHHHHDHDHDHTHNTHSHHDHHHETDGKYSSLTKLLLSLCEPGSLVYTILNEKDSRRIAYFTW